MWLGYIGQVDVYWLYTCCLCFRLLLSHRFEKLFHDRFVTIIFWFITSYCTKIICISLWKKIWKRNTLKIFGTISNKIIRGLFFYVERCIFRNFFIGKLKHCAMDIPNSIRGIFYHVHIDFIHNVHE